MTETRQGAYSVFGNDSNKGGGLVWEIEKDA